MRHETPLIWTVAHIAEHLSVKSHQIEYIIASRQISALCRAGNARVFSEAAVQQIALELDRIRTREEVHSA